MQAFSSGEAVLVWFIAGGAIAGLIFRPRQLPEAVWACLGALLLVVCGLVSPRTALAAAGQGIDVYLFLTGMMLMAELARREGVFDWLATLAVRAAKGSSARLFALVYAVGVLVTVFLSNDATAVVLTPAVFAAVRKARVDALAYLFVCAFIANAASFVLPISNPANLVVYGKSLPALAPWLRMFLLPSLGSIAVTFLMLRWLFRNELGGEVPGVAEVRRLPVEGRHAAWGLLAAAVTLLTASALDFDLGLPTCAVAAVVVLVTTKLRGRAIREVAAGVSWSVLPLVAGLFILVEALNRTGAIALIARLLESSAALPGVLGQLAASFGVAGLSNLMNNLPSDSRPAARLRMAT